MVINHGDGLTEIVPFIEKPNRTRRIVIECACCSTRLSLSFFEDGTLTVAPFQPPPDSDDECPY
jgi:hypothetical protein